MNYRLTIILLAAVIAGGTCLAQTDQPMIKDDFKPSTLNQPGQQYPQVNSKAMLDFASRHLKTRHPPRQARLNTIYN